MPGLFYYLPGVDAEPLALGGDFAALRAALDAAGLGESLADVRRFDQVAVRGTAAGPDARSGSVVYPLPPNQDLPDGLGYYPDRQTWSEAWPGLWVGWAREPRPAPSDLRRRGPLYDGYEVELGDGQAWTVPVVRSPARTSALYERLEFTRDGTVHRKLSERCRALWEASEPLAEMFFGEGPIDVQAACRFALAALGLNYRLGAAEVTALQLVDTHNWQPIVEAALDLPLLRELLEGEGAQKKTAPASATVSTAPGLSAVCLATDPAGESSSPPPGDSGAASDSSAFRSMASTAGVE